MDHLEQFTLQKMSPSRYGFGFQRDYDTLFPESLSPGVMRSDKENQT